MINKQIISTTGLSRLCLFSLLGVSCAKKTAPANAVSEMNSRPENKKPNIIYILTDDLGYGDISANAPKNKIKTPHIDQMAREGIRFTDAHTSSAVSTPTRYSILTGRYNWRSPLKKGVLWGTEKALIPKTRETVASLLQKQGYSTAYIGKWHLGWDWPYKNDKIDFTKPVANGPKELGFGYSFGHVASLDMAPYVYVENGMPTSQQIIQAKGDKGYGYYRGGEMAADFDIADVTPNFFRKASRFISEHANKDKPFFLYLPLPSPHTPILPTKEWQGKSGVNPYGDFVMMIDHYVGKLNQQLKELGIEKETMVIFTSDNGCSPAAKIQVMKDKGHHPNAHFRGHKADAFEGGHRVPFIVKWPEVISAGRTSSQTICTTDFMATSAALCGADLAEDAGEDSYSLLPILDNDPATAFERNYTVHHSFDGLFAITQGEWKLLVCAGSGGWSYPREKKAKEIKLPAMQLYHLTEDPSEKNNLYFENKAKAKELMEVLMKCVDDGRSTEGAKQQNDAPRRGGKWWQLENMKMLYQTEFAKKQ
ncbi:MAG: arylsulfatase [Cytophagales bacterium]|nr:arylsulfatase [Cytophagales bacterium]